MLKYTILLQVNDPNTGLSVAPPWTVEYDKYHNGSLVTEEVSPGVMTEDKKLLGHCIPGCMDYEFDHR